MQVEEQAVEQLDDDLEQEIALESDSEDEQETESEMLDDESNSDDDDEVIVTIGEDSPPQDDDEFDGKPAPQWVKDLRKRNRELERELKQSKEKPQTETKQEQIKLGEKPKLEQYGYDEEQYAEALDIWYESKAKFDKQQAELETEQKKQQEQFQAVLNSYEEKKKQLKVRNFDDAEHEITDKLSVNQQALILEGADNPALVVYALGTSKDRLTELAKITNPAKFAFAVAKLEMQMKATKRKANTAPEKKVSGAGSVSGTVDSTLERLRAEAAKSGDYTKVIAHKKQMKRNKD